MSRDGSIETWSRLVVSETELSESARDIILNEYRVFPYCMSAPASRGVCGKMLPTLLCRGESKLGIVKVLDNEWETLFLRLEECVAFESGYPGIMIRLDYKYFTCPRSVLAGRFSATSFYHSKVKAQGGVFRPRVINFYYLVLARGIIYVYSGERIRSSLRVDNYSMVIRHVPIALWRIASRVERGSDQYSRFVLRVNRDEVIRLPVEGARLREFLAFTALCGIEQGCDGDETTKEA